MKKNSLIIALTMVIFLACAPEEVTINSEGFDWISDQDRQISHHLEVGDKLEFFDVSVNPQSHKWVIEDGSYFLTQTYSAQDSIFDDFIAGSDLESSLANVSVLFTKPGENSVQLANTFMDSVGWFVPGSDYTLSAEKNENGLWAIDTTFVVDVFDKLAPSFSVSFEGQELVNVSSTDLPSLSDVDSWPTVDLEEGEELVLTDLSTIGRPTGREWTLDIGSETISGSKELTQAYNIVGDYLGGTLTVNRFGEDVPNSTFTKLIPLKISVSYSSSPIEWDENAVTVDQDDVISFGVKAGLSDFTGAEGNFTVHVKNGAFDNDISVQTARISDSDEQVVELILSEPVYNSDTITVEYDGLGSITNDNGFRSLSAFGPAPVSAEFGNGMADPDYYGYDIEWNGSGNQYKLANSTGLFGQHNGNSAAGPLHYWRDEDMKHDGISSMKFNSFHSLGQGKALTRLQGGNFPTQGAFAPGDYRPMVWVYLDAANTMTVIKYSFSATGTNIFFDITDTPREQWVRLAADVGTYDQSTGRLDTNVEFSGTSNADPGAVDQIFWLDTFEMVPWEVRP